MSDSKAPPRLPPGFDLVEELHPGVLRARRDGADLVVRVRPSHADMSAEWAALARVRHPGVIVPVDWGRLGDHTWVARPWLEGSTLDVAVVGAEGHQVADWARDLLDALGHIHAAGLVHRDVRAANVVVSGGVAHLVDLDLVAESGASSAGTADHLAPEVRLGAAHGPSADLFALGVTLATACLGAPRSDLVARFPAEDFWEASGLDPEQLPPEVRPLVGRLVLRRPGARPLDARSATELLDRGEARAPHLELPPLAGRQDRLDRVAAEQARVGGRRLLVVEDDLECDHVLADLSLSLACTAGGAPTTYVLDGRGNPREAVAELRDRSDAIVVAPVDAAASLDARLHVEGLTFERVPFPGLLLETLERHLDRVTGGVSTRAAAALAGSLHAWSRGKQSVVELGLRNAPGLGVLERAEDRWVLLVERWPEDAAPGSVEDPRVADCSSPALMLASLLDFTCTAGAPLACAVRALGWSPEQLGPALAELRGLGLVDPSGTPASGLGAAARGRIGSEQVRSLLEELLRELDEAGVDAMERASLALVVARTEEELSDLLTVARGHASCGHHARARELARGVELRALELELSAARDRALIVDARLDLSQLDAPKAEQRLESRFGPGLESAPSEALLVAAHAAELRGHRKRARELYTRTAASTDDEEIRLQARVGLGYGRFLDGDSDGALAEIEGLPGADDPDEAAGAVHNLRFGALVRAGRLEDAGVELDAAERRAASSGDPGLLGRTALNRGFLLRRSGRLEEAAEALTRAVACFDRTDDVKGRALAANNAATLRRDLGDLRGARADLQMAIRLRRQMQDTFGEASSRGSLALVELEAGRVGVALKEGRVAAATFAEGGHTAEARLLDLHLTIAHGMMGDAETARELLGEGSSAHPLLAARARAVIEWVDGDLDSATAELARALDATEGGDVAEELRAAALWCALAPDDARARAVLAGVGARAGESRRREVEWRLGTEGVDVAALQAVFDSAGRLDLARAVALSQAHVGSPGRRRTTRVAADAAAEALLEGVPAAAQDDTLARLDRLAGLDPEGEESLGSTWFLECNRSMARSQDLEDLLRRIVDMAIQVTGARRGFLVLLADDRVEARVSRGEFGAEFDNEAGFSTGVILEAARTGRGILSVDASSDERFQDQLSVRELSVRAVLCVPFAWADSVRGAVYVDHDGPEGAFDQSDLDAVSALADQAAIAIGTLRQREQIEELNARLSSRVAHQAAELEQARAQLRRVGRTPPVGGLVGESAAMQHLHLTIQRLGPTALPVLITGPSGAGKDLVARALHDHSPRADGPFIVVNSAALPRELLESELFGHVRGAFSGAAADRRGLFVEADGGTFFLDEIGDLPLALQAKLLRVLESGEVRPVGGTRVERVQVRIVAATNRPLMRLVEEGEFRRDLYYRLDAAEIEVPSLTERLDDVPLLAQHFLTRLNEVHGRTVSLGPAVLSALARRAWPGEVRELSNEIARLFFLSESNRVDDPEAVRAPTTGPSSDPMPSSLALIDVERAAVLRALEAAGGKRARAAELLGISRAGLYTKLKRLGIEGAR